MTSTYQEIAPTDPISTHRFRLTFGDSEVYAASMSGLDQQSTSIVYRDGIGGIFQVEGQPSLVTITLQRCTIKGGKDFLDWCTSTSLNAVDKRDIKVSLSNESGTVLFVSWTLSNAFPISLAGASHNPPGDEGAFEEITLAADRLSFEAH